MYIKLKTIIEPTIHSSIKVDILASDKTELQIQVEKSEWGDFFFDLTLSDAIKLREGLNEFIAER